MVARAPRDPEEAQEIQKLAASRTAPRGLSQRAQIIALSWSGASAPTIAGQIGLHPKTVRTWLGRFNAEGVLGLAERHRSGRPRVLAADQRDWLVRTATASATWTLSSLVRAAEEAGISVSRSQVRRILLAAQTNGNNGRQTPERAGN